MQKNNYSNIIVANWKMNLDKAAANILLDNLFSNDLSNKNVVICPPFTLLDFVRNKIKDSSVLLGAQDCSSLASSNGAFTGDISAQMLCDLSCKYVICGHSERRKFYQESDEIIKNKIINAHKAGLVTILCVGESLSDRENGKYKDVICNSVKSILTSSVTEQNTIIAYEPIWAIGTGKTATEDQIEEIHQFLSDVITETFELNLKILYGGSVNEENSASILKIPHVSGLLIGGASLDSKKFYQIIKNS